MLGGSTILLTGATGFVGGQLLARLLARDGRPIVCLVRAPSEAAAARRGDETLARLVPRDRLAEAHGRVTWRRGDVERADLGLDADVRRTLAREVAEIIHCAATTRFDLPLAEAERINVAGLLAVRDFAAQAAAAGGFRRLHHVSTAYAAGRCRGVVRSNHLPDDRARNFRNTYERTKASAERLLRLDRRVPATVYRPSIIVGDSRTGCTTSWNVVYFPMRLMARGRLPFAPHGGPALLDCVPVDYVADGILALGARDDTAGAAFHLTAGTAAMTVHDVIRQTYAGIARRTGRPLRVGTRALGPARWWLAERALCLVARGRARDALARFRPYAAYTHIASVFDNRREAELLAAAGVTFPDPETFFPRIVDYALAHDFGRHTAPAAGVRVEPVPRAMCLAGEGA